MHCTCKNGNIISVVWCDCALACPLQEPAWAGWALPASPSTGRLMHCSLYMQDVLHYCKTFMDRAQLGVEQQSLRSLDMMADDEPIVSLEERNKKMLDSFFAIIFQQCRGLRTQAGVQYKADSLSVLRNHDLIINNTLQPGVSQFFDPGEVAGPNAISVWVAAEGFFSVLRYTACPVAQKKFTTPLWVLEACGGGMAAETIRVILFNSLLINEALFFGAACDSRQDSIQLAWQAECFKGDFVDEDWVYRGGSRKQVGVLWTGPSSDEFQLVWDGMLVDLWKCIIHFL